MSHDNFESPDFEADVFEGSDERFADWVDGRLSKEQTEAFEQELALDDGLRRQAEEYRDTVALLRRHLQPDDPPEDLIPNVMAQLPGAQPTGRLIPFLASLTAAAAMIMLYFVLSDMTAGPEVHEDRNASAPLEAGERADADANIAQKHARDLLNLQLKPAEQADDKQFGEAERLAADSKTRLRLVEGAAGVGRELAGKKETAETQLAGGKDSPLTKENLTIDAGKAKKKPRDEDAFRRVADPQASIRDLAKKIELVKGHDKSERAKAKLTKDESGGEFKKQKPDGRNEAARKSPAAVAAPVHGGAALRLKTDPNAPPTDGLEATSVVGAEVRRIAEFYLHEVKALGPGNGKARDKDDSLRREQRQALGGNRASPAAMADIPVLVLQVLPTVPKGVVPGAGVLDEITRESNNRPDPKARSEKTTRKRSIEGKKVGGRGGAAEKSRARDRSAEQPSFKRARSHALLKYLDARDTGKVTRADLLELTMLSPPDAFSSGVRVQVKQDQKELDALGSKPAASRKSGDYAYQTGDQVFSVSGDRQQIRQFFAGLRDYLASRSPARSPTSDRRVEKPTPNRSRIPIVLRRLATGDPSRATIGRAMRDRTQASGQLRFLVVLRARR